MAIVVPMINPPDSTPPRLQTTLGYDRIARARRSDVAQRRDAEERSYSTLARDSLEAGKSYRVNLEPSRLDACGPAHVEVAQREAAELSGRRTRLGPHEEIVVQAPAPVGSTRSPPGPGLPRRCGQSGGSSGPVGVHRHLGRQPARRAVRGPTRRATNDRGSDAKRTDKREPARLPTRSLRSRLRRERQYRSRVSIWLAPERAPARIRV
jgi:hypothetical protein